MCWEDEGDSLVTLFYSSDTSATTLRIGRFQPTSAISLGTLDIGAYGQQILISPVSG